VSLQARLTTKSVIAIPIACRAKALTMASTGVSRLARRSMIHPTEKRRGKQWHQQEEKVEEACGLETA
jgi:hypothetical protein